MTLTNSPNLLFSSSPAYFLRSDVPLPKPRPKVGRQQLEGHEVKLDPPPRPMSSSACKGRSSSNSNATSRSTAAQPSSSHMSIPLPSQSKPRSHTAPSPSVETTDNTFCDEAFFSGGNFELAEHFASANEEEEARVQHSTHINAYAPPPPQGAATSRARSGSHLRNKRHQGPVHAQGQRKCHQHRDRDRDRDLVKGIANIRKETAGGAGTGGSVVNEGTLRNLLTLEWGGAVAEGQIDDWSRTVEALSLKKQKQQQQQQTWTHKPTGEAGGDEEGLIPKQYAAVLGLSPSKEDFVSIMSSITDVEEL